MNRIERVIVQSVFLLNNILIHINSWFFAMLYRLKYSKDRNSRRFPKSEIKGVLLKKGTIVYRAVKERSYTFQPLKPSWIRPGR